jgi:peptide-methionine (S)-S-oxide reductase
VGTQYRTAIFVHDEDQRRAAEASRGRAQERFHRPIATEIVPATTFWPAEEYHQRYLEKRGMASCTLELQEADAR